MKLNLAHLHFSSLACSRFVQPLLYYFKHISCFCSYQKSKLILYFPETFNQGINGVVHVEFGLFKKEIDKLVPNESYYFHLSGKKKKKKQKRYISASKLDSCNRSVSRLQAGRPELDIEWTFSWVVLSSITRHSPVCSTLGRTECQSRSTAADFYAVQCLKSFSPGVC